MQLRQESKKTNSCLNGSAIGLKMDGSQFNHQRNTNIYGTVHSVRVGVWKSRDFFVTVCILNHKPVIFSRDLGHVLHNLLGLYITVDTLHLSC